MRVFITICCCLILASCGKSRIAPLEIGHVRKAIAESLNVINMGIVREDEILASQPVHDLFEMDDNIAIRYRDQEWGDKPGQTEFRKFFRVVFENHANIYHTLTLLDVELTGDVATARVDVAFSTTRVDRTPPEGYVAEGTDLFIFERVAGQWLLIKWDEAPIPPPHDEGVFEDI